MMLYRGQLYGYMVKCGTMITFRGHPQKQQ